jgi:twinkle protein
MAEEYKAQCPRCAANGRDRHRNNLHVYGDERGSHCFSCGYTKPSSDYLGKLTAEQGYEDIDWESSFMAAEVITDEELDELKQFTTTKGFGVRGISDLTYKWYGVRTKVGEEDGKPLAHFYPIFEEGSIAGFKVRKLPKSFSTIGKVGNTSELFGLFRYRNSNSKVCVVTAGEIDCMSARDMLVQYAVQSGWTGEETPVVSPVTGETGSMKQLKAHYEWFDRFDKIILIFDNDEAGKEATDKAVKVLPKGKVYIASFNAKDVNELLEAGKQKEFINAYFKARQHVPVGIVGSGDLASKILEEVDVEKIMFPPFMSQLNEMTGGLSLGRICNIGAGSGF